MSRGEFIGLLKRIQGWRLWLAISIAALLVVEIIIAVLDVMLKGQVLGEDLLIGFIAVVLVEPTHLLFMRYLLGEFAKDQVSELEFRAEYANSRFRQVIEISQMNVWEMDIASGEIRYEDEMLKLLGVHMANAPHTLEAWLTVVHPDDRAPLMEHFQQSLRTGSFDLEYRVAYPDGLWGWVRTRGEIVKRDTAGKALLAVGASFNVTARKQAELALQQEKQRFETIFNNTPELMVISRLRDGCITHINEAVIIASGFSRESLLGRTTLELNIWRREQDRQKMVDALTATGYCHNLEVEFTAMNGIHFIGLLSAMVVEVDGEPHIVSTVRDISDQKRIESQLQANETLLRSTLESTDEGILMIGQDGGVLSANKRFTELWHVPPQLAGAGRDDLLLAHVLDQLVEPEVFISQVQRLYDSDEEARDILNFKDGRVFARYTRALMIGEQRGRIWCFRDVTEQTQAQLALADSEAKFRSIFSQARDGILLVDPVTTRIVEFNDAACANLGYSRAEFNNFSIKDIQADFDDQQIAAVNRKSLATGGIQFETRHKHKDGSPLDMLVSVSPIKLQGKIHTIAILTNITERKQNEDKLRASEQKMLAILDNVDAYIYLKDTGGNYLFANRSVRELWHAELEDIIGCGDEKFFDAETATNIRSNDKRVLQDGEILRAEEINTVPATGKTLTYLSTKLPLRNKDGSIYALCGISTDITERKQMENALAESNSLLNTIIDAAPIRIFWKDKDLRYMGCNTVFARDAGLQSPQQLIGKDDYQMGWKDQAELYRTDDRRVMDAGIAKLGYEEPQTTPDGSTIWLRTSKVPLYDGKGKPLGVLGLYQDITASKLVTLALQASEAALLESQVIAGLGSYTLDIQTGTWSNSAVLSRIFGIDDKYDRTVASWEALVHPEDRGMMHDYFITEVLANKQAFEKEYRIVRHDDKQVRWVYGLGKLDCDKAGNPLRMRGTIQDITARKQSELKLLEREASQRALLDNFPFAVWLKDAQGRFLAVNQTFASYSGHATPQALIGKTDLDIWPQDLAERYRADDSAVMANAQPKSVEEYIESDGRRFWSETYKSPIIVDGVVLGTVGFSRDISERKQAEQALLSESEKNLALLHNASDGIHILNEQGYVIEASDAFCDMLGYTRDEVIGMHVSQWDTHFTLEQLVKVISDQFSSKERIQFETLHRRKDGSVIEVEVSGHALLLDGKPALFNSSRDISMRRKMELTLQQQLKFTSALNNISRMLVESDDLDVIMQNTISIVGATLAVDRALIYDITTGQQQVVGLSEWLEKSDTPSSKGTYPLAVFAGGVAEMQRSRTWFASHRDAVNDNLSRDGSAELLHGKMGIHSLLWYPFAFRTPGFYVLVLNSLHARRDWSREEIGFLDSVSHIVAVELEKHRLTQARLEAEAKLRVAATAFESHEGMIITDAHGIILQVNRAFTEITGYSAEGVIGRNPRMLASGQHDNAFYAAMWDSINRDGSWEGEVWNRRKNGEVYPEHLTITAVKNEHGVVSNYVGALTDSTQRQHTLEELRSTAAKLEMANMQVEEERARLAERVEQRTAQLSYANKAKDSFLATMSHEIRTPLGGLLGMMEMLGLSQLDAAQRENLSVARKSGQSLLRIVDDILDWSKIEAGKLQLAPRAASLAEMLRGVANTYVQLAKAKNIELREHVDDQLASVHVFDPLRLSQILNNFTSNAIKFTAQGTIEIHAALLSRHDGYDKVRFSVKDSGVGIDQQHLSRLFHHYEQASADTARMYGGTGLGLSICRSLADLMEGAITVESLPGVGSTFSLTLNLPVADVMVRSEQRTASVADAAATEVTALIGKGQHVAVLMADDHPVNRMLLKQQLGMLGLQVEAAADGTEALALWQDDHFDLVITDCHMPEMDGYELTRRIRSGEKEAGKHVPIIAWTANVLAEEEEHCRSCGMDDILTKPTGIDQLREKLAFWLDKIGLKTTANGPASVAPAPPSTPEKVALDLSVLRKVAQRHESQVELLREFDKQNQLDLVALLMVLRQDDPVAVQRSAHRIKGASRMMGALELEDICTRIEAAAKQGDLPGARNIAETSLDAAMDRLKKFIQGHIGLH